MANFKNLKDDALTRQGLKETFLATIKEFGCRAENEQNPAIKQKLLEAATFMKMKLQHTYFVRSDGVEIFNKLKEAAAANPKGSCCIDSNLEPISSARAFYLAEKYMFQYNRALLWHDLGRIHDLGPNGSGTGKSHPVESEILANEIYKRESIKDDLTVLIIRNHGYSSNIQTITECRKRPEFLELTDEEQEACIILSLMVRDADKLGNWKTFVKQGINRAVENNIKDKILLCTVAPNYYEYTQVMAGKTIDYSKYMNFTGVQLAHIMWYSDFALAPTKEAALGGGYIEGMIIYMNEVAQDDVCRSIFDTVTDTVVILSDYKLFLTRIYRIFQELQSRGWIAETAVFDTMAHITALHNRLDKPNFEKPRVYTNGLKRYVKNY